MTHFSFPKTCIKTNPKFKAGAKIEQISVSVAVHFEYADGNEY